MEALTSEKQAGIRKMSSERLREYLLKAGRDEDEIMTSDRNQLMEEWAIEVGKREEEEEFKASPASPAQTDYDLQKRRLEFEMYKFEKEERRREVEREEREKERAERKEKEE